MAEQRYQAVLAVIADGLGCLRQRRRSGCHGRLFTPGWLAMRPRVWRVWWIVRIDRLDVRIRCRGRWRRRCWSCVGRGCIARPGPARKNGTHVRIRGYDCGVSDQTQVRTWLGITAIAVLVQQALVEYPSSGVGPHLFWIAIAALLAVSGQPPRQCRSVLVPRDGTQWGRTLRANDL